ncbi:hypothetical protein [uncultured Succinivibrio sp.]|uniref:hypothetical protein n=1 Tax=uncultured Succinivibrio sp. TaxID=540749 RepID=UPI0025DEAD40|nr:hypothetical protein [uncultured Succinivibrio sp.]
MDVRLKSNVLHKGVVLEIGTTFSLSDKEASDWIERGLAEKIALDTQKVEQTDTEKASETKKGRSKK